MIRGVGDGVSCAGCGVVSERLLFTGDGRVCGMCSLDLVVQDRPTVLQRALLVTMGLPSWGLVGALWAIGQQTWNYNPKAVVGTVFVGLIAAVWGVWASAVAGSVVREDFDREVVDVRTALAGLGQLSSGTAAIGALAGLFWVFA